MPARKWSLSFLVALWVGVAVAVLLGLFILVQYLTTPEVSLSDLILRNVVRLIIFGGVIHVCAFLIIRMLVLGPIDRLHRHLYRVGTGQVEEIDLATRVQELQTLEDGVNLMVQRMKHGGLERAVEAERDKAAAAGVPQWIIDAGDRPAHLSMTLQQTVDRKERAGIGEWWPAALVVVPLATVIGLVYWLQPDGTAATLPGAGVERMGTLNAKLDKILADNHEQARRLKELESSLAADAEQLRKALAAGAAARQDTGATKEPAATTPQEQWTRALQQLSGRIDTLEGAQVASEEEITALRGRLAALSGTGGDADPDVATRIDDLLARLALAEARVDELEGTTGTVAGVTSRGFLADIQRFIEHADNDFRLIRGERLGNDRVGERGQSHRSRDPFPGAVSTKVWDVAGERWCEAVLHEDLSRDGAMAELEALETDINNLLPEDWNMTPVRVRDYEAAQKILSPDGGSFRIACYQVRTSSRTVWVVALEFGR